MHCTDCDKYSCRKDFKIHSEKIFTEMDKIVEERNRLHDEIINRIQHNDQHNPLIEQIDKWQNITIEKIKQVAAQVRQQAQQFFDAKWVKINTEFKSFSQELAHLKELQNYAEYDLTRLNQGISQFKQDLTQSIQPTNIVLHTEQADKTNWKSLIYVEEKQTLTNQQCQKRIYGISS